MTSKNLLLGFLLLIIYNLSYSQNVGIGTTTPQYPLTVIADNNKGITQKDGNIEVGFYTADYNEGAAILQTWSNHKLHFATNNLDAQMTLSTDGNLGIGQLSPIQKLHVNGNGTISGGLGLGVLNPSAKLHVSGDGLISGSLGLGTTSPSATLDINGSLRFRNTAPATGAVLTSTDANGNAEWAKPLAFKTTGCQNASAFPVVENTWTKMYFNQTSLYNLGLGYQVVNSQFLASENGIYHFDTQLSRTEHSKASSIRIMHKRGNTTTTISENYTVNPIATNNSQVYTAEPVVVACDVSLQINDLVWVEIYFNDVWDNTPVNIQHNAFKTYFSGHLVVRN